MGLYRFRRWFGASVLSLAGVASAAPLDGLLSADQFHHAGELRAELSLDAMNQTLDVMNIRGNDPVFAGTNVGDYSGQHLRLEYALTQSLMLQGGLWRRKLSYTTDQESIDSWQLGGQWRLFGNADSDFHLALRASAWGNRSPVLTKNSPTTVSVPIQGGNRTVDTIRLDAVQDTQSQFDAIGTWRLGRSSSVSGFVGIGRGTVSTGNLSATYTSGNGCNYLITFTATDTFGSLAAPCAFAGVVVDKFGTNQSPLSDFSYDSSFYQLGGMWLWQSGNWALRTGYQFQHLIRNNVDALVASQGGISYQNNHIVVADVFRKINTNTAVFVRGQAMSNQFVGEIPFLYNNVTASKFNRRYGIVSFGVNVAF